MSQHPLFNTRKSERLNYSTVSLITTLILTIADIIGSVDIQGAFLRLQAEGIMPEFIGGLGVNGADRGLIRRALRFLNLGQRARVGYGFATEDLHPWGSISLASSYNPDLVDFLCQEGPDPAKKSPILNVALLNTWISANPGVSPLLPHALFTVEYLREEYLPSTPGNVQFLWPDHALEDDEEEMTYPAIRVHPIIRLLIRKGWWAMTDSYGGGAENNGDPTGLIAILKVQADLILKRTGLRPRIFLIGIAGDFCLAYTALQLIAAGFDVVILVDVQVSISIPIGMDAYGDPITTDEVMVAELEATGHCQFAILDSVEANTLTALQQAA